MLCGEGKKCSIIISRRSSHNIQCPNIIPVLPHISRASPHTNYLHLGLACISTIKYKHNSVFSICGCQLVLINRRSKSSFYVNILPVGTFCRCYWNVSIQRRYFKKASMSCLGHGVLTYFNAFHNVAVIVILSILFGLAAVSKLRHVVSHACHFRQWYQKALFLC